jgi:SNF2 family DNA or RNA helicase
MPAPMLRRMKDAARDGLPRKIMKTYKELMPQVQATAYSNVLAKAGSGGESRKQMLETLHRLRGVSLHPHRADDVDTSDRDSIESWIGASARLSKCADLLRTIAGHGEKAIVFIEDLAVQRAFAESMAIIFDLEEIPSIINGSLVGEKRQAIVDRFQKADIGFDLLVLSPRAAGLGLTITAATHVLHLSRWWNPAVEDQCNDRAYRIGQNRDVTVHIPLAVHPDYGDQSFDVKLDQLLERKRTLSRDILLPPELAGDLEGLFGQVARKGANAATLTAPIRPLSS